MAIDPGPVHSAFVMYQAGRVEDHGKLPNAELLALVREATCQAGRLGRARRLAVEMIASYGMPVGAEVFETCVWIGRLVEAWGREHGFVYRREVKLHICGQARAKDGNVRQALIDRFGGKDAAIGRKASPGPLYGVAGDVWQALAVAVTFSDEQDRNQRCVTEVAA